jgi:altronate hydrolase
LILLDDSFYSSPLKFTSAPHIRLNEADNIVVAAHPLGLGSRVEGFAVADSIAPGHKVAIKRIEAGEPVLKYGQVIGYASRLIEPGSHVHEHNCEFRLSRAQHQVGTNLRSKLSLENGGRSFMGYDRGNGRYGTRNFIAVLTSVNCSATAARAIAENFASNRLADYPNVDGVVAFVHGTGCAMDPDGEGFANLKRVLWGYAGHPNCGGVLMVGLGCETNQVDEWVSHCELNEGHLFRSMTIQGQGGLRKTIETGVSIIEEMLPEVNRAVRCPCPVSGLTLGLQCGGSDAWSGMTANPSLGHASDLIVSHGGTTVLAETPEVYGAEHLLTSRARNRAVADALMARISWWEDYVARNGGSMNNNPSPGNKRGGLTTILEKSLGAVAKSGTLPLEGVYRYGEKIDCKGFVMMDSPGYDPASITGQIASGCNLVAFTTGRGSVYGSKPAPSIKIATNSRMFNHMHEDMDVNAGRILDNDGTVESVGEEIFELLIEVASGVASKSEAQGLGDLEFVPWQIGAVM